MNANIFKNIVNKVLQEYSSDQRLPFDDDYFKNKNYLEQYTDWLEDFGKYGELPPSKLDFWSEIKKAINVIIDKNLRNHKGIGLEDDFYDIFYKLSSIIGSYLNFNNRGHVYVERRVKINRTSDSYDISDKNGIDPKILYNNLVKNYNNNVGGCWSYKMNGSEAYCTYESGDSITLKGFIRTDDIDFVKTVLLNFHYPNEHEIRVKPNANVELFEVDFNCKYKIPLKGRLIVSSTYFGNNGKYNGNYAKVDDGFGNFDYIDRHGKISKINDAVLDIISNGGNLENIFDEVYVLDNNLYKVKLNGKYSIVTLNNGLLNNGETWFDWIGKFSEGFAQIRLDNKETFINTEGNLINGGKFWFNKVGDFVNGFARVKRADNQWSFINTSGEYIRDRLWFDYVDDFNKNGLVIVSLNNSYSLIDKNGEYIGMGLYWFNSIDPLNDYIWKVNRKGKVSIIDNNCKLLGNGKIWLDYISPFSEGFAFVICNDKYSFIDDKGKFIGNGDLWFDYANNFKEGLAQVEIGDKTTFINTNGEYIGNGKLWFDYAGNFKNGFAKVEINNMSTFINTNGEYIGNGKLWFDNIYNFRGGFARVELKNKVYWIDTEGNFYDYETKQPIENTNENKAYFKSIIKEMLNIYLKNNLV